MGPAVQHRRHAHNTLGSRALAAEFLLNLFTVFVFIATGKASPLGKSSTTICQPARGKNNLHVSIYKYLYIYICMDFYLYYNRKTSTSRTKRSKRHATLQLSFPLHLSSVLHLHSPTRSVSFNKEQKDRHQEGDWGGGRRGPTTPTEKSQSSDAAYSLTACSDPQSAM